jgi:hypothetical protein
MADIDHKSRAHALLSASSAHRWLACPPSAVAAEAYPQQDTEFTREGTIAHEVAEIMVRAHLGGNLPTIDDGCWPDGANAEMIECATAYAEYIEEQIHSTDALVLLEQRVDFSPWVPDGFGTADCIIIQNGVMDVIDYKYGVGVAVSAVDNPQEKLYGLGAVNDYGFAYDVHTVRLHIYQPRINNISVDELAADALLTWGETVKPVAEQAIKGKGKYCAGSHCKFCPHGGKCRELTRVCSEYVETHGVRVRVPKLAPHEVAEVLSMEPLVSMWLKRVRDTALSDMMNGETVPGYKIVAGRAGARKWSDELAVAETLKTAGYGINDITETKLLSPAAMDKSIGKKRVAELLDSLIDRAPGAPTIAPESDKRPVYDRVAEAIKDFE